jgi:microcystin degradation protein MlrC
MTIPKRPCAGNCLHGEGASAANSLAVGMGAGTGAPMHLGRKVAYNSPASVGRAKVAKTMDEWKAGTLHSGSKTGPKVTSQKQAVAIALSQARRAKGGR